MTRTLLDWLGLLPTRDTSWVEAPIIEDPPLTRGRQALELGAVFAGAAILAAVGLVVMA